jgi:hypothetical protein
MSNPNEWSDTINDPDFSWTEYCQELQDELIALSNQHLTYQTDLKNLVQDLNQVTNQGAGYDPE